MTKKEAQIRNGGIMQFRGMYNRINSLIPDDIKEELNDYQLDILEKASIVYNQVNDIMNKKAKHKHLFLGIDNNNNSICINCGKIKYSRNKKSNYFWKKENKCI